MRKQTRKIDKSDVFTNVKQMINSQLYCTVDPVVDVD